MIMSEIQQKLKAPKGQTNAFGKYKYRSCEDIVEALKPILAEYDAWLNISDEMVQIGDRYYVKATAEIMYLDPSDSGQHFAMSATAYAREPLTKKGMDEAQITGATSSYARKYALNGLLAIDDTKDADTQDNREQMSPEPIDMDKVAKAIKFFKEQVDLDDPDATHEAVKAGRRKLSNDEWIRAQDGLQDIAPDSRKKYKTLVVDHIEYIPSEEARQ